jgi:membrane dipeptidase
MLIIDAHLDLSWNALQWNRDLLQSVYTIRTQEQAVAGKGRGQNTVALPEMRQGQVFLSFVTMLARSTGRPIEDIDYRSTAQAYATAQGQLAYYRALEQQGHVQIIENKATLESHLQAWQQESTSNLPLGFVLSMEGADPILEPEQLEQWHKQGLRLLGPTHYGPGRYAGGTATELGLTDLGKPLLKEMSRLGILLDMTHLSDQSFWEVLEHYEGYVLASHNNARVLVPHQRQFSDEQLKAIFARDGVVGVALDSWMLKFGWNVANNHQVTLEHVCDHIAYMCELAGDTRHVALGTDLDGGFGREQSPGDLDTIVDLQKLVGKLQARGFGQEDVEGVMYGNWLRFLKQAW